MISVTQSPRYCYQTFNINMGLNVGGVIFSSNVNNKALLEPADDNQT